MRPCVFTSVLILSLLATRASAQSDFVAFESSAVRPVAISQDGSQLFVVNTPDNTLEVFDIASGLLSPAFSVPVGMEPVSVAPRPNTVGTNTLEVWVVNHLSDSVSVVDLTASPPRVTRTLLVGDGPEDIVFAGSNDDRAFIATAHRGQHRTDASISGVTGAGDPQLTTPGVGRADVWVFDATSLGNTLGGTPLQILTFFSDSPRALAVSPDGNTVYVAAHKSGNQTTVINDEVVPDAFVTTCAANGSGQGIPGPSTNCHQTDADPACEEDVTAPFTGLIVKFDGSDWVDALGCTWNSDVPFDLPDYDVFSIDANTLASNSVVQIPHVGTILFNMEVNPQNGNLYVTNTELPNHIRFEGPGIHGGSTVQGQLSKSRITVIDPDANGGPTVDPQHLNQHIVYSELFTDPDENNHPDPAKADSSLATPVQLVVSADGSKIYLAAYGSSKIGVFDVADIEDASFEANFDPETESANYIDVGGGPAGLALDEANGRLYVLARFANEVEVVNLATGTITQTLPLHNPEPASVVAGRPFLYDAFLTSGNGEASCSSCHIWGDKDELAWNLGDPDAKVTNNTQPSPITGTFGGTSTSFHPMKGPMTTQTLKGFSTHGAGHWRGDRVDGFFSPGGEACNEPSGAPCSEELSFKNFIVAFEGLVGKDGTITEPQMQAFTDFMLQVQLPPNPVRPLDNTPTGAAATGASGFFGGSGFGITDQIQTCDGCHTLDPPNGFFGTGGFQTFENESQNFKVAHMRNLFDKIGMFSVAGDQIRGFGFLHDGSVDTVETFLEAIVFSLSDTQEKQLEAFSLQFPTDFAPIVAQQVTLTASNRSNTEGRADLMETRAGINYDSLVAGGNVPECDMIAKGSVGGSPRGWWRHQNDQFLDDTNSTISYSDLKDLATDAAPITFTCVPPGSGERMGINRDRDNFLDGLDNCPAVANDDQTDTDMNGVGDACEVILMDADMDGVEDSIDNCVDDDNPGQEDFDGDGAGDACDDDDDDDGLLDVWETNTGTFVSPTDAGTDPFNADTDGDGVDDGKEVGQGFDPTDTESTPPVAQIPSMPVLTRGLLAVGLVLFAALVGVGRRGREA